MPLVALRGVFAVIVTHIKVDFKLVNFLSAHSKHEKELQISPFTSLKEDVDLKIMILERKINVEFLLFVFLMIHSTKFVYNLS